MNEWITWYRTKSSNARWLEKNSTGITLAITDLSSLSAYWFTTKIREMSTIYTNGPHHTCTHAAPAAAAADWLTYILSIAGDWQPLIIAMVQVVVVIYSNCSLLCHAFRQPDTMSMHRGCAEWVLNVIETSYQRWPSVILRIHVPTRSLHIQALCTTLHIAVFRLQKVIRIFLPMCNRLPQGPKLCQKVLELFHRNSGFATIFQRVLWVRKIQQYTINRQCLIKCN